MIRKLLLGIVVLSFAVIGGGRYWISRDPSVCSKLPDYTVPLICGSQIATSMDFKKGQFPDALEVRFFSTMSGDGHPVEMVQLLKAFRYIDSKGVEWSVPDGFISDGASIPEYLWLLVGGPYSGPYRDAAVVHDYYCVTKSRPWMEVHDMFLEAALNRGTPVTKAETMYAGILFKGPRWNAKGSSLHRGPFSRAQIIPVQTTPTQPPAAPPPPAQKKTDAQLFQELQQWIEKEKPTREEIRKRVEEIRKLQGIK